MGNLLYYFALILIIGWLVGFIGFQLNGIIHLMLVTAVIIVIVNLSLGKRLAG